MAALLSFVFLLLLIGATSASTSPIGVTYNPPANSQPRPPLQQVANRLQSLGITSVRLSAGDSFVLHDFSFSTISILLTVPNHLVPALAANRSYAAEWLDSDVIRFYTRTRISAISIGSDVLDANAKLSDCLIPAIRNVQGALDVLGIRGILVSTSFSFINTLTTAIPPSAAEFQEPAGGLLIKPLLDFLQETNSSFLISLDLYELYRVSPEIPLGFALFQESLFSFVDDPQTGNRYWNLYETMIDAVVTAMTVAGHKNIPLVVVETGWPSSGSQASEADANPVYAEMFLRGLVRHLNSKVGTPLRKDGASQVFVYELFDSHGNVPSSKSSWGILYPNMTNKYDIDFTARPVLGRGPKSTIGVHRRLAAIDNDTTSNTTAIWWRFWDYFAGNVGTATTTANLYNSMINRTPWDAFFSLCGGSHYVAALFYGL